MNNQTTIYDTISFVIQLSPTLLTTLYKHHSMQYLPEYPVDCDISKPGFVFDKLQFIDHSLQINSPQYEQITIKFEDSEPNKKIIKKGSKGPTNLKKLMRYFTIMKN